MAVVPVVLADSLGTSLSLSLTTTPAPAAPTTSLGGSLLKVVVVVTMQVDPAPGTPAQAAVPGTLAPTTAATTIGTTPQAARGVVETTANPVSTGVTVVLAAASPAVTVVPTASSGTTFVPRSEGPTTPVAAAPAATGFTVVPGSFDNRGPVAAVLSAASPLPPATLNNLFPEVARPIATDVLPFQAFPTRNNFVWRLWGDDSERAVNLATDTQPAKGADRVAVPAVPPAVAPPAASEPAPPAADGTGVPDADAALPLSSSAAASAAEEQPAEASRLLGLLMFLSGATFESGTRKRQLPASPRG
jgi:hypothetical protein